MTDLTDILMESYGIDRHSGWRVTELTDIVDGELRN